MSNGDRRRDYVRPTQPWACGHDLEGETCRRGPDPRGRCCAQPPCTPELVEQRWQCTRPAVAGGPCKEGPYPDGRCRQQAMVCLPRQGSRAVRRMVARWLLLLSLGCLMLVLAPGRRGIWLSPGAVSRAHGAVTACAGCHPGFAEGPSSWVVTAAGLSTDEDQQQACLVCHRLGDNAAQPHSVDPQQVKTATRSVRSEIPLILAAARALFPAEETVRRGVACSRCHREHRGADARLAEVDDARCQSCHQEVFASFAQGHPEFSAYPARRRTHLVFDHAKHFSRHFAEAATVAPRTCQHCHTPGLLGRVMETGSFEQTCAACHRGQIDGTARLAGSRAIPVIAVPGIDTQTLAAQGNDIGTWPRFSEQELTPFLALLLASDPELRTSLAEVSKIDDLLDLTEANKSQLRAVAEVAWGVKQLLLDLSTQGATSLVERLHATMGQRLDRQLLTDLVAALPRDTVESAIAAWFPGLAEEVAAHRAGTFDTVAGNQSQEAGTAVTPSDTGETQPAADETAADDEELLVVEPAGDDELLGGDDLVDDNELLGDDELLAGDELLGGEDDLLAGEDFWGEDEVWGAQADDAAEAQTASVVELDSVGPEEWAAFGGWYRRDVVLYYRPVGHADPFMRAWLDLLALTFGTPLQRIGEPVFAALTDPLAPGACAKCHSVDQLPQGGLRVNWWPTRRAGAESGSTVFSHTTHTGLSDNQRCDRCHQLAAGADVVSSFKDRDPMTYASSFVQIDKQLCAACHNQRQQRDRCTTCHRYHWGERGVGAARTLLADVAGDTGIG